MASVAVIAAANPQSLLVVLVGGLAVGFPALAYTIWRGRKQGPKEEQEIIARTAKEAVEMMDTVLTAARQEREEMQRKLNSQTRLLAANARQIASDEERIEVLEARVDHLEGCVAQFRAGVDPGPDVC
jgi:uncharacterized protein HemX